MAKLADGTIAASVAPMNDVVKTFEKNTSAGIAAAVELVTKNPARELKIYDKLGSLEVGKSADIIIFDKDFSIQHAIIDGEKFF